MWSPQHYKAEGIAQGHDPDVVGRAAIAIGDFLDQQPALPVILTLGHLAKRANVPYHSLRQFVDGPRATHYEFFRIRKRSGGHRLISKPELDLMQGQRWISSNILSKIPAHRASYAFAPESSIIRCTAQHCKARWLIKLDITGFFGSISEIQVYRVFRGVGYAPLVAFEMTRLCTHAPKMSSRYKRVEWKIRHTTHWLFYRQPFIGYLPQGAPTSPMLSNLVMRETDRQLAKYAQDVNLTYTRYSDDITFSTQGDYDRTRAAAVISRTTALLGKIGLRVNKKTRVVVNQR